MNKDRLELLKETEDYIPPIHTLGTGELQSFYSQFGAAPEIIREMFLSGEIFHKLLYSDETPPVMRLDKKSEETAFKNFLSEKNISDESVFLIYNYSEDEVDLIATAELADKGVLPAIYYTAIAYEKGWGTSQNPTEMMKYLQKSSDNGNPMAITKLKEIKAVNE